MKGFDKRIKVFSKTTIFIFRRDLRTSRSEGNKEGFCAEFENAKWIFATGCEEHKDANELVNQ